jgi:ABC-type antimicrobial peptide transport system permease subunit
MNGLLTLVIFVLKDLRHDWGRSLLGMTGLAVMIFSYQILTSLGNTFADFLNAPGVSRNLVVVQSEFIDPGDAVLEPAALDAARSLGAALVKHVSPLTFRHIRINDHLVQLRAAPPQDWQSVFHLQLLQGNWPTRPDEIIAGEGTARANRWNLGSSVEIYGSPFRISGIFRSPGTAFASLWMPLDQARLLFGPERIYQAMYVQVADQADVEDVSTRLRSNLLIGERYAVFLEDTYTYRNNKFMKDFRSLMLIAGWLALLAVVFGTFSTTNLSLVERAKEIGTLRAIGFSHNTIRGFLLARTLLQGLLAYAIGLAAAWVYVIYQQASARTFILGVPLVFEVSPQQILVGCLWTCALVILGAWISSRQLMGFNTVDLLRD